MSQNWRETLKIDIYGEAWPQTTADADNDDDDDNNVDNDDERCYFGKQPAIGFSLAQAVIIHALRMGELLNIHTDLGQCTYSTWCTFCLTQE